MSLILKPPLPPMEARSVDEIPVGDDWQYEPKWDGFRCIAFRDSEKVFLQSKAGQPLARYFPDVVEQLQRICQRTGRGAMAAAGVAEEDEHPRRPAGRCGQGRPPRRLLGYLRRAAARRAIQRMLYWASR